MEYLVRLNNIIMSSELKRLSFIVAANKQSLTQKSRADSRRLTKWTDSFLENPSDLTFIKVYKKHISLYTQLSEKVDMYLNRIRKSTETDDQLDLVMIRFEKERLKLRPFQPLFASSSLELLERLLMENHDRLTHLIVWVNYFRLAVSQ